MQLISVNLGKERIFKNNTGKTGIYKFPTTEPVAITKLGLDGDAVSDTKNHGGPDQAVYVYGAGDYDWWSKEIGRVMEPGMFGDNLTISELESANFNIGDMIQVGAVTLQVTAPRIPCSTFAARMEDPMFVKKFRKAGRPGLYCRVLKEGAVKTGDPVSVERWAGETISVAKMFEDYYNSNLDEAGIQRELAAPIAVRARKDMEDRLAKRVSQ